MQHSPIFLALALANSTAETAAGFRADERRNSRPTIAAFQLW
ncbi:hypothetical protein [Sinorhizobium medicae]|nr:hypothetical protein [Sinorhizobium medicae]WQO54688.1 hypothetical protein U8C36_19970 [Sinorhizobium medicae]